MKIEEIKNLNNFDRKFIITEVVEQYVRSSSPLRAAKCRWFIRFVAREFRTLG